MSKYDIETPYIIVYGISLHMLAGEVDQYIKAGYTPQGGVAIDREGCEGVYVQAMVRVSNV